MQASVLVALTALSLIGTGAVAATTMTSHPATSGMGNGMNGGYGGGMMEGGSGYGGMMGGTGGCGCQNTQYCQQYMNNYTWDHNTSYGMMP